MSHALQEVIRRCSGLAGAQVQGVNLCYALNATKTGAACCRLLRLNMMINLI